jgi:hypothetical protein
MCRPRGRWPCVRRARTCKHTYIHMRQHCAMPTIVVGCAHVAHACARVCAHTTRHTDGKKEAVDAEHFVQQLVWHRNVSCGVRGVQRAAGRPATGRARRHQQGAVGRRSAKCVRCTSLPRGTRTRAHHTCDTPHHPHPRTRAHQTCDTPHHPHPRTRAHHTCDTPHHPHPRTRAHHTCDTPHHPHPRTRAHHTSDTPHHPHPRTRAHHTCDTPHHPHPRRAACRTSPTTLSRTSRTGCSGTARRWMPPPSAATWTPSSRRTRMTRSRLSTRPRCSRCSRCAWCACVRGRVRTGWWG